MKTGMMRTKKIRHLVASNNEKGKKLFDEKSFII